MGRLSWTGTGHSQTPGRKLQRSARGRGADPSQDLGMRGGVIGGTESLGTDREEDTPPPLPAAPPQSHTNLKEFISPRWRDWRTWRNKGGCGTQNRKEEQLREAERREKEEQQRREDLDSILKENQTKIEEQHRKMAEERLQMIEEQMRIEQDKQKLKRREEKKVKNEQKKDSGKKQLSS